MGERAVVSDTANSSGEIEHERVGLARALGKALSDEWSDEGCSWSIRFDDAVCGEPWAVTLDWRTDRQTPHHADYMRLTWEFWGRSTLEAIEEALSWVRDLEALRPCSECDGQGSYWIKAVGLPCERVTCPECNGAGLFGSTQEVSDGR